MVCWVLSLCQTSCCVFYPRPLCYRVLEESILSSFNSNYHYYDNYGGIHHLPSAYCMSDINLKTFSVFIITIPLSLISPNYCYSNSFLTMTALWAVGAVHLNSPLPGEEELTCPKLYSPGWISDLNAGRQSLCSSPHTTSPLLIHHEMDWEQRLPLWNRVTPVVLRRKPPCSVLSLW